MNINGTILTMISVFKTQILFSIFFRYYFDIFSMFFDVFFDIFFRLKVNSIFCRIRCVDVSICRCFHVLTFRCFVFRCLVWHPHQTSALINASIIVFITSLSQGLYRQVCVKFKRFFKDFINSPVNF